MRVGKSRFKKSMKHDLKSVEKAEQIAFFSSSDKQKVT